MIDSNSVVLLIASTLILSYVSGLFYNKTRVPDIVWLTLFGILLGPLLNIFDKDLFVLISPLMSTVALSVILFDAGYNIDLSSLLETMGKSFVLASVMFVAILVVVGFLLRIAFTGTFSLVEGLLLASMIGGSSTIAVVSILDTLKRSGVDSGTAYPLLVMESVISDPICIVAAITLIKVNLQISLPAYVGFLSIFNSFVSSALVGFFAGLIWAAVLARLGNRPYSYVTTLAILFPVYVLSEVISGSGGGPIAALAFGLSMNNSSTILGRIGIKLRITWDHELIRIFHAEITHLIKSFFFVYIGLIVSITLNNLLIGLGISVLVLGLRYVVADGVGQLAHFSSIEMAVSKIIFSQGLPAMVMSQLPMIYDPAHTYFTDPGIYVSICVPIVLITVIFDALFGPPLVKKLLRRKIIRSGEAGPA